MKTYVKVSGEQYPATVIGQKVDTDWGGRDTKTIELALPFEAVASIFYDGVLWSIIVEDTSAVPETSEDGSLVLDETGKPIITVNTTTTEYDNSAYSLAGPIFDWRNGKVSIKMGMPTPEETANTAIETLAGCPANLIKDVNAMRSTIEAAMSIMTDGEAAKMPSLSQKWVVGEAVNVDDRRFYEPTQLLYKCRQAHTTQADWTPDQTPALWAVIDVEHAGTKEDPITAARGMEYEYGLYYLDTEDGKTYLCERIGEAEGGKIILQYLPHELIGNYFSEA